MFAMEIDNKKLQRALVREVGEETPLAKVLEEGSDWKGRREQIIALRDQVKLLKTSQVRWCLVHERCKIENWESLHF